ncbi:MAG: trehalose-6-phosphate synthase [Candidatus Competibacteraceae bacterium]|nr:trehalose-6-phosphate synthase [Candidatus Competibacteraceae bacterium]
MKLILKFVIPLIIVLGIIGAMMVPVMDLVTQRWFIKDLELRSQLVTNTLQESLQPLLLTKGRERKSKIQALLDKVAQDERILAMGYCDANNVLEFKTILFPADLACQDIPTDPQTSANTPLPLMTKTLKGGRFSITATPLVALSVEAEGTSPVAVSLGRLIIVHDLSVAERRSDDTRNYLIALILIIGVVTSLVAVLVARWSRKEWMNSMRTLLNEVRKPSLADNLVAPQHQEFQPILRDIKNLMRDLEDNRAISDDLQLHWTPQKLREILSTELSGDEVIVVSNRQPYIHSRVGDQIEVHFPASGLVTAMEPIVRACSGVWVAHGNGSADREVVDERDRVKVPPDNPQYEIHRVWLSKEEELGYYYGFSNEGLWPLCHIAHTRPIFRGSDWEEYVKVNQKFADAVVRDARSADPVVLIQDYHFALLPQMIRAQLPQATIITFWHIPWPNQEVFGICPWREAILEGLLGSTIMGFHTRYHANNFIDTVDRFLESRIERETSSISYNGKITLVRPYPISIEWPPRWLAEVPPGPECLQRIHARDNIPEGILIGIGVDRLDYTKGIVERFRAIERLLEKHPEWIGQFSFVQIAAPSRSSLPAYQHFDAEVRAMAEQINIKYGDGRYQPIILKIEHHEPVDVFQYFRAAVLCLVSSLHDGMNLVAKEYLSARDDEQGVLILSMFAGASRELTEALIVNPYDIEQCAEALHVALSMPASEQRERMHAMRSYVSEFNIFRWAGRMLLDAATVRRKNRFALKLSSLGANAPQLKELS